MRRCKMLYKIAEKLEKEERRSPITLIIWRRGRGLDRLSFVGFCACAAARACDLSRHNHAENDASRAGLPQECPHRKIALSRAENFIHQEVTILSEKWSTMARRRFCTYRSPWNLPIP